MVEDAEVLDFLVGAWVLGAELVAGEGEDFEVAGVGGLEVLRIIPLARWQYVSVLGCLLTLVKSLEVVELRRETALAGRVDDKDDLALQLRQRVGLSILIVRLEVVESGCGRHCS